MKNLIVLSVLGLALSAFGATEWSAKDGRLTKCQVIEISAGVFARTVAVPKLFAEVKCEEANRVYVVFESPMLTDLSSLSSLQQILLNTRNKNGFLTVDYDAVSGREYRVKNISATY